jgi:phosphate transport system permease protein
MSFSGSTLTVALYVYAKEQGEFEVAFVIAAIMLIMSMLINFTARRLSQRIKNKRYN